MSKFKKTIRFDPGWDYIVLGPKEKEKCGRHGMTIRFILKGEKGAIHFSISTGWMPRIKRNLGYEPTHQSADVCVLFPMAEDISYHSRVKLDDYLTPRESCVWLDGDTCYSDGSILYAEEFMATFFNEGEKALWKKMKEYYKENLEKS